MPSRRSNVTRPGVNGVVGPNVWSSTGGKESAAASFAIANDIDRASATISKRTMNRPLKRRRTATTRPLGSDNRQDITSVREPDPRQRHNRQDFWSGRRDSNPRPSPWQREENPPCSPPSPVTWSPAAESSAQTVQPAHSVYRSTIADANKTRLGGRHTPGLRRNREQPEAFIVSVLSWWSTIIVDTRMMRCGDQNRHLHEMSRVSRLRVCNAQYMAEPSVFLTTDRLVLRRFTLDDADDLLALDSDPLVRRFVEDGGPVTRDN